MVVKGLFIYLYKREDGQLAWGNYFKHINLKYFKAKHVPDLISEIELLRNQEVDCIYCWIELVNVTEQIDEKWAEYAIQRKMEKAKRLEQKLNAPKPKRKGKIHYIHDKGHIPCSYNPGQYNHSTIHVTTKAVDVDCGSCKKAMKKLGII